MEIVLNRQYTTLLGDVKERSVPRPWLSQDWQMEKAPRRNNLLEKDAISLEIWEQIASPPLLIRPISLF
jgi:hypothetical protein